METAEQPNKSASSANGLRWLPLALVVLTIIFVGYIRYRIADTPLERDEGEYAYGGQLILHGIAPYKDLYNIKLPGTYGVYALLMAVFGQTPTGIHFGLALVNAASIVLMYLIGKRISGSAAGVLGAVLFAFITLDPSVMGFAAQATHFVVAGALAGFYFLLRAQETGRTSHIICGGVFLGVSFLCKQPGLFFGAVGFAFAMWIAFVRRKPTVRLYYAIGWLAPYAAVCALMWAGGCFGTFWLWTTKYAGSHSDSVSVVIPRLGNLWNDSATWMQVTACCCAAGLVFVLCDRRLALWKRVFLVGLVLSGIAAIAPGFSFYRHYLIMLAPGVALVIAVAVAELVPKNPVAISAVAGVLWSAWVIASLKFYMFTASPQEIIGHRYADNPFLQCRVVGSYLAEHCSPEGRIAVLESEPEILFYARRKSATGFIYAYDMTALGSYRSEMEEQFKRELIAAEPEYVVFVRCFNSWSIIDDAGAELAEWCRQYPRTNYTRVVIADNLGPSLAGTVFKFDNEAANYTPQSRTFIEVFRRNAAR